MTMLIRAPSKLSPDEAMTRFAAGDRSAFAELYAAIAPQLAAYSLRLTRDLAKSEDLTQHTFEMLYRARGRFKAGARVMPWARSILRNRHHDLAKRPKLEELSADAHVDAPDPTRPDPLECTTVSQHEELLLRAMEALPVVQREACELFYFGGLSQSEIAAVLEVSVAAVKSRLQRALEALRHMVPKS